MKYFLTKVANQQPQTFWLRGPDIHDIFQNTFCVEYFRTTASFSCNA